MPLLEDPHLATIRLHPSGDSFVDTTLTDVSIMVFILSGQKCSRPGSVTALFYSHRNRTESRHRTGYSHSLHCSLV